MNEYISIASPAEKKLLSLLSKFRVMDITLLEKKTLVSEKQIKKICVNSPVLQCDLKGIVTLLSEPKEYTLPSLNDSSGYSSNKSFLLCKLREDREYTYQQYLVDIQGVRQIIYEMEMDIFVPYKGTTFKVVKHELLLKYFYYL